MIDAVQVILLLVVVLLTTLLILLGIQVFLILKDLRQTITKANRVLDNAGSITDSVSGPMSFLSSFILGTKVISKLIKMQKNLEED